MRIFAANMVGTNKREIRDRLYQDILELVPRAKTFAMLAGEVPEEEAGCIRYRFFRPEITAYDKRAVCIDAARAAGLSAVRDRVEKVATECDVFNLDLCATLVTSEPAISKAARVASHALSVFVSYRDGAEASEDARRAAQEFRMTVNSWKTPKTSERVSITETSTGEERVIGEEAPIFRERVTGREESSARERVSADEAPIFRERVSGRETSSARERVSGREESKTSERVSITETSTGDERVTPLETPMEPERTTDRSLLRLSDAQLGRILLLTSLVTKERPTAQLVRAYAYKGNEAMMIGALYVFKKKPVAMQPPYCPAHEEHTIERQVLNSRLGLGGKKLRDRLSQSHKASLKR